MALETYGKGDGIWHEVLGYGVRYVNGVHYRHGVHHGYGAKCEFRVYHLNGGSQRSYVELWTKSKMIQEEEEEEEGEEEEEEEEEEDNNSPHV